MNGSGGGGGGGIRDDQPPEIPEGQVWRGDIKVRKTLEEISNVRRGHFLQIIIFPQRAENGVNQASPD